MAIGGLKEKSMAAYKHGIAEVLIPLENESDLWEVDPVVKEHVAFFPVDRLEDVFRHALLPEQSEQKEDAHPPLVNPQQKTKRDTLAQ